MHKEYVKDTPIIIPEFKQRNIPIVVEIPCVLFISLFPSGRRHCFEFCIYNGLAFLNGFIPPIQYVDYFKCL